MGSLASSRRKSEYVSHKENGEKRGAYVLEENREGKKDEAMIAQNFFVLKYCEVKRNI